MTLTCTLHGVAVAKALDSICFSFAFLFIKDTATNCKAAPLKPEERERLRDCRATLESIMPELPMPVEPDWPLAYRRADMRVVNPGKVSDLVPGFPVRFGYEEKPKRGAKQYPRWSDDHATKAAKAWREAFYASLGVTS